MNHTKNPHEPRSGARTILALAPALLLGALATACGGAPPRLDERAYPGIVHAPSRYSGDFVARQRIEVRHGARVDGFDAVVQKRGDTLVLIALTPYNTRAFVIEQRGTQVTFTSSMPGELPFPPRFILLDVHRALFAGLPRRDGEPLSDGMHRAVIDGERVSERWSAAHLVERRFERVDGVPAGAIVVHYGGTGLAPEGAPTGDITLTNGWLGYVLRVTTVERRALPDRSPST